MKENMNCGKKLGCRCKIGVRQATTWVRDTLRPGGNGGDLRRLYEEKLRNRKEIENM